MSTAVAVVLLSETAYTSYQEFHYIPGIWYYIPGIWYISCCNHFIFYSYLLGTDCIPWHNILTLCDVRCTADESCIHSYSKMTRVPSRFFEKMVDEVFKLFICTLILTEWNATNQRRVKPPSSRTQSAATTVPSRKRGKLYWKWRDWTDRYLIRACPAIEQIFIWPALLQLFGNIPTPIWQPCCWVRSAFLQTFEILESELILSKKAT